MFVYVGLHLLNHALGLVSFDLAESALRLAVALWHSLPGTLLLYGAAAVHVALAFDSLYRRRSLRLPAIEWVRMTMGFGMPILLIGHVVATRTAFEVYGLDPDYARVIRGIWSSGNEWLQLGLLAPGWIHGCLGLHIAFGHRHHYRRAFLVCYSLALLLPVVSAIGFWSMSRELERRPPVITIAPGAATPTEVSVAVRALRRNALYGYGALFGLVALARLMRGRIERGRRSLITVAMPNRELVVPRGWSVLEGLRSHGIAHASICGGRARCSTCRVRVIDGLGHCPTASGEEARMLTRLGETQDVRLACQLRPSGDVRLLPLLSVDSAHLQPHPVSRTAGLEHEAWLLRFDVMPSDPLATWLASDVWWLLQDLMRRLAPLARRAGARMIPVGQDQVLLIVGARSRPDSSARDLITRADATIAELSQRSASQLGSRLGVRLTVHRGPVAIQPMTVDGQTSWVAVGEGVSVLGRLAQEQGEQAAGS